MNVKNVFAATILLLAILLCSCANESESTLSVETASLDESTETSTEKPIDPFALVRSSGEEWIAYGLAAYEDGKQPEDLKEFFSDRSNLTYLTLYDHFFEYDKEKTVPVAEALFAFIFDKYGIEAILDIEKRCEYKDAYLDSLGVEAEYKNAPEAEAFLSAMDFSSDSKYKYIISFDKVTYYFEDFDAGSPAQYHGFLYYSTQGLYKMIEYLRSNGLNEGFDTDRNFNYYMTLNISEYSKTVYSSGDMYMNDSYSTLHEAMHAMGITQKNNIWLSEGLCNYFGKALGFNDQVAASYIQLLTMAKQGYFDEQANAGNEQYVLYKKVYEDYIGRGGKIDSVDTFDFRLYADANARVELDAETYKTLGYAYELVNNKACDSVGKELSYEQATSLILYLVDAYGIETVLQAYHTQDIELAFGKGYDALRADWLTDLFQENH